jgi:2-keto-3-deoxy-L-rhamnonate aldolase RhmA
MDFIRERVLSGEFMVGAWCNLGSSLTVEMAARIGYDWILLDQEHGPGDNLTLLHQMQAAQAGKAAPIVRIAWNEMPRFKRALDLGAKGIMIPYVQNAEEARMAVDSMRYSPEGSRGVASSPRAAGFGREFDKYYAEANRSLLTVVQIETGDALNNLESIATVDGVDVLFVGPLDLSVSLNMPARFDDLAFREVLSKVAEAAKAADKAAGILLPGTDLIKLVHSLGFTFVAAGADGGMVVNGFNRSFEALSSYK